MYTPRMFTPSTGVGLRLSMLAASLVLAGCSTLGPEYQRPQLELPLPAAQAAQGADAAQNAAGLREWWRGLADPVLDQLMTEAAQNNQDLQLAAARVAEASAMSDSAHASRLPTLDAQLAASKMRISKDAGKLAAGASPFARDYQPALSASYEVDLWGKLARADQAARARLLAQSANREVVQSALYSNLAQAYFSLRANDAALALAQAILATREQNLQLQQKRYRSGSIGEPDLHVAESEADAARISQLQAQQALTLSESALAVLLGRSPAAILHPVLPRGQSIDQLYARAQLPADLPSDLLERRPDLIAAEQSLIAANADISVAKAQYFPSIRLTSAIGYEAGALRDLFSPGALMWNLASSISQPLFHGGALTAAVEAADARKAQARAQYVQTVQGAFRDVHDALANAEANQAVFQASQHRVKALADTLRLTELRYQNGYSGYLEVLSAQRDLAQAQFALIDTQRSHLNALVSLYKAVGGGWDQAGWQAKTAQK